MIVGSLIKNPGGGLAPIGGYIAGKKECVDSAAYRLSCSGTWKRSRRKPWRKPVSFYQGFFLCPDSYVAGALKGAIFAANVYERLGFGSCSERHVRARHDIIQASHLRSCPKV